MTMQQEIMPEFSVEVDLSTIGRNGKQFRLSANEQERQDIARRFGVIAVHKLEGDVKLTVSPARIQAVGAVRASLIRECVASLEDVAETIDEEFEIEFLRRPLEAAGNSNDPEENGGDLDQPEMHEADVFDVGELLVQQLSLAMDPFPRKDGAPSLADQFGRADRDSPFAALRDKLGKGEKNQ